MNAQFANTFADRLDVAGMPLSEPIQSRSDNRSGAVVPEPQTPFPKHFGLLEDKHM